MITRLGHPSPPPSQGTSHPKGDGRGVSFGDWMNNTVVPQRPKADSPVAQQSPVTTQSKPEQTATELAARRETTPGQSIRTGTLPESPLDALVFVLIPGVGLPGAVPVSCSAAMVGPEGLRQTAVPGNTIPEINDARLSLASADQACLGMTPPVALPGATEQLSSQERAPLTLPIPVASNTARTVADSFGSQILSIELHVQHQHGAIEIISVPWSLSANGELSQIDTQVVRQAGGSIIEASTPVASASGALVDDPLPLEAESDRANAARMEATMLSRAQSTQTVSMDSDDEPVQRLSTSTPAVAQWIRHLARIFEQHGRDPTIWIRDYALDDPAARQVADNLRALSQQQGIRLERIVVNAREIWRAPSQVTTQETI